MPATKPTFNPSKDTHITTFFLHQDQDGNLLDIDTHLYHSGEHGFYLQEKKVQVWIDRCWETVSESDHPCTLAEAPRRVLTCACRPMTPGQVVRLIIENHVPEEEGALKTAMAALDAAGVK